jgi:hypothetical protein
MCCASCGFANPEEKKFCEECGTKLVRVCPSCGAEVRPAAKFCGDCGTLLTSPPARRLQLLPFSRWRLWEPKPSVVS